MNRDGNRALRTLMQEVYIGEAEARAVLIKIDYPVGSIPKFGTADTFWPPVLSILDAKVESGTIKLLKATAEDYPGRKAEMDRLIEQLADPVAEPGPEPGVLPRSGQWHAGVSASDSTPPLPPPVLLEAGAPSGVRECPTLTLEGANLAEQFLAVARELLGTDTDLLYVTREQSALRIPDPGDQDEAVRQRVQDRMRTFVPSCRVTYRKFPFRPYLYKTLLVYGPDTSPYELSLVPATSTPEDLAAAIVAQTHEAKSGAREGVVRVVVDRESAETSVRLDPYATLHECGVREGDRLRVAIDAIAGCLSPELRMEALLRAAAQIRGYAARHRAEFAITDCDDEDLPTRMTVEITRRGLAPPADLGRFLAGDCQKDLADLTPVPVKAHRISIHFRAMFPLVAPYIVWESPVFHPNIRLASQDGFPAGTLQFHPLLLGYRPEVDLAHIARMMTDVATYRDYDPTEGFSSPNPVAALWAGTEAGQTTIKAIGGRPLADVVQEGDRRARPPRLFWLKPLGEVPHGH